MSTIITVDNSTEPPTVANRVGLTLVGALLPFVGLPAAMLYLLGLIVVAVVQAVWPLLTGRPAPPSIDMSLWVRSAKHYRTACTSCPVCSARLLNSTRR